MTPDSYTLAGTDVSIPLLGVGTWAWGDRSTWGMGGYDADLTMASIEGAWDASIDAGVTLFDTGDFYGMGHNEMLLGRALEGGHARGSSVSCVTATRFGRRRSCWRPNSCRRRGR